MVALVASVLISLVMLIPFFMLVKQGKYVPGAKVSWGEANVAAMLVLFWLFWVYGVVPHQWLTLADNEWNWRPDRTFVGPGAIFEKILPFKLNYLILRDLVAVHVYILYLVLQARLWRMWRNMGDDTKAKEKKAKELAPSTFGRPLVRKT